MATRAASIGAAARRGTPPTTYKKLYEDRGDIYNGNYNSFYRYWGDMAIDRREIAQRYANSDYDLCVNAFFALVTIDGEYRVITIHRPTRYTNHPTEPSRWDDRIFAIEGERVEDLAQVVPFGRDLFTVHNNVSVFDEDTTSREILGITNPTELVLAPTPFDAGADTVTVRRIVPVPHAFCLDYIGGNFSPIELWEDIAETIRSETDTTVTGGLDPLRDWLRVACTASRTTAADGVTPVRGAPAVHLGELRAAFPLFAVNERLLAFTRNILKKDFPDLRIDRAPADDRVMAAIDAFADATAQERREAAERRAAKTARKEPKDQFPYVVTVWRKITAKNLDGSEDALLPPLYGELANAKKPEMRICLQTMVEQRAMEPTVVSRSPAIMTKEVLEMILSGKFAPTLFQMEDLTIGISPFTCGFFVGDRGDAIMARTNRYDLQQSGQTNISLAELEQLATKEVYLPENAWQATQMLEGTSLVLDVLQGPTHYHAQRFREFLSGPWKEIVTRIMAMSNDDRNALGHIWARLLREVQITMANYFREECSPTGARTMPDYNSVHELVMRSHWSLISHIPSRYMKKVDPKRVRGGGEEEETAPGNPQGGSPKRNEPVTNPSPNSTWVEKYKESGKKIADLRPHAPKDGSTEVCLSYHLRGTCYATCARKDTHKQLAGGPLRAMHSLVNTHCQPAAAPNGTASKTEE